MVRQYQIGKPFDTTDSLDGQTFGSNVKPLFKCAIYPHKFKRLYSPTSPHRKKIWPRLASRVIAATKAAVSRRTCGFIISASSFWRLEWGSFGSAGFAQAVPGTPTRSSCRPQLALGAAVFANRTVWRPCMAHSSAHPPVAFHGAPLFALSRQGGAA